ncbi:MAG: hypothetical protein WCT46_00475 [Candidatus Gracilibacteria bacterium]|jgi:hypothetical protein
MKICFSFQRNFAKLQHCLAIEFKKRGIATEFCGYSTSFKAEKVLLEQKEIKYGTIISDNRLHEKAKNEKIDYEYLEKLEKEYGIPNLWPYLITDRCVTRNIPKENFSYTPAYDHEWMLKLLQVASKEIIEMLDKEKPDILIMPLVGNVGVHLLYEICKKKKVKTLFVFTARIDDRMAIYENAYNDFSEVIKKAKPTENDYEMAKEYIQRFKDKEVYYAGTSGAKRVTNYFDFIYKEAKGFVKYINNYSKTKKDIRKNNLAGDYTFQTPYYYAKNRLKRFARRLKGYNDIWSKPVKDEKYAFFPLHVEPEVAVSVFAPYYDNQIEVCRMIAKSLPVTYKLYVKEHPDMLYNRSKSYYKKLLKIPNVRLIDPFIGAQKLIKNAKLITTITGTAGMEGYVMGKPVITFGSVMYNVVPSIKRIKEPEQLPFVIRDLLENYKFNEEEALNFIASIYNISESINIGELWLGTLDEIKQSKDFPKLVNMIIKNIS